MKGIDYIKSKQIYWAKRNCIKLFGSNKGKGLPIYVKNIENNLFESLTRKTKKQFLEGDGGELKDTTNRLAKMKALHSSSAIGVNIFQYWDRIEEVHKIAHSCELCNASNNSSKKVFFEKKYEIDKTFQFSPNIDVVIENQKQSKYKVFAIECKFSEAYGGYGHTGINKKYIEEESFWEDIPKIYDLAKKISPKDNDFKYLHSAQLIKHILGLKKEYGKKSFRLLYLWYDVHGKESCKHREEIAKFTKIVKSDGVKFSSISYQELISNLADKYYEGNEKYINYVTDRYL